MNRCYDSANTILLLFTKLSELTNHIIMPERITSAALARRF